MAVTTMNARSSLPVCSELVFTEEEGGVLTPDEDNSGDEGVVEVTDVERKEVDGALMMEEEVCALVVERK